MPGFRTSLPQESNPCHFLSQCTLLCFLNHLLTRKDDDLHAAVLCAAGFRAIVGNRFMDAFALVGHTFATDALIFHEIVEDTLGTFFGQGLVIINLSRIIRMPYDLDIRIRIRFQTGG